MTVTPLAAVLLAGLALSGCQRSAQNTSADTEPQPTATVVKVIEIPTPEPTSSAPAAVEVEPKATPCGAEKLQNYLNLLPTSTAKDEIARTLGHNRIRYVPLAQEKAEAAPGSMRVTAGLGVDGRVKEFTCG
jgi:hypothetical protein